MGIHYEQINTIMFGDTNTIVNLLGKKSREIKIQGKKNHLFFIFCKPMFNGYKKV